MHSATEISFVTALPSVDWSRYRALSHIPVHELHYYLQDCERRLGTPNEQPDDFERARHLAHEINNRMMVQSLKAQLTETERRPHSLVAQHGLQRLVA